MARDVSGGKNVKAKTSKNEAPKGGAKKLAQKGSSLKMISAAEQSGASKNTISNKAKKEEASPGLKQAQTPGKTRTLGSGFGRNINKGVAEPRFAKKRKHLEDKAVSAKRKPRETKKMKQRRSILAAVVEARLSLLKRERKRPAETPGVFKLRSRKTTPVVFSLEEVQAILKAKNGDKVSGITTVTQAFGSVKKKDAVTQETKGTPQRRVLGAASIQDILGFNPKVKKRARSWEDDISRVPKKWLPYYKALIKLRDHFHSELSMHTEDSLKKSVVEDLGDNQDLNDGSSESCNRDLVLSLVSSEQEALYEIDEAIQRIFNDTYGTCEVTQKPISRERLSAVPFTRYSIEGQADYERSKRRDTTRFGGSVFASGGDDDAPVGLARDDIDDE